MAAPIPDDRPALPAALLRTRVVAVLRGPDPGVVVAAGAALFEEGVSCLEVALTTPGATGAIARLRDHVPDGGALGAGTVLDARQAEEALAAGARFLVSPAPCPAVVATALTAGCPALPGAFTPGEVLAAWHSGASAVKLFPAATGGPGHVRDLRGPLPHIPLVPTGGIGVADARAYLAAGAVAVGMGSSLTGRLDGGEELDELRLRARRLLAALSGAPAG